MVLTFLDSFLFPRGCLVVPAPFAGQMSLLHCIAFVLLSRISSLYSCGFSGLPSLFRGSSCLFLCQYHPVSIPTAGDDVLQFRSVSPLTVLLLPLSVGD